MTDLRDQIADVLRAGLWGESGGAWGFQPVLRVFSGTSVPSRIWG
jgi:hypothetical protein